MGDPFPAPQATRVPPSFRRRLGRNRRGVSPIVGTILLVLITVALAAGVWIAIINLTHVSPAVPLNGALSLATEGVGTAGPGCPVAGATCFWYNISITLGPQSNGITPSNLLFGVETATGGPVALQNASLAIWNNAGTACIVVNYDFGSSAWVAATGPTACPGASPGTPIAQSTNSLVLEVFGPASGSHSASLAGDNFILFGQNGFSGSLSVTLGAP
jgi:flagellin-like protein